MAYLQVLGKSKLFYWTSQRNGIAATTKIYALIENDSWEWIDS